MGCRFAAAIADGTGEEGQAKWMFARLGLAVFFAMIVMVFSMALWSQEVYETDSGRMADVFVDLFRYTCLLGATPVLLLLGGPLVESAWDHVRQRRLTSDVLLAVGVAAAYGLSVRSVVAGEGPIYFEVACVILVAVTLGRWLEVSSRLKTSQALRSLEKLLPSHVRVVEASGARSFRESSLLLDQVQVGQLLRVLPGERIPIDGVIRRNQAAIDEQLVTGESQPAVKELGDRVLAGTINLDGDLLIEVTASPQAGMLQRLVAAVCQAALSRSRIQKAADRIASWFLPVVTVVALLTFAGHYAASGVEPALLAALSVLLIACPCALGVATPLAIWGAMGRAVRAGVLFRNGDVIQRFARVNAVVFDKTGTLTTGHPEMVTLVTDGTVSEALAADVALRLASASTHSLSKSIREFVEGGAAPDVPGRITHPPELLRTLPGRGIAAVIGETGGEAFLGSLRMMQEAGQQFDSALRQRVDGWLADGMTMVFLGWGGRVRAAFVFREELRESSVPALSELQDAGCNISVLTGDHQDRGRRLATQLGVPVLSEQLPEQKLTAIQRLRELGGRVAMVGDGINDAPALAAADVGIALGCGADVSRDTADVCLLGNDLRLVAWSRSLAQETMRTVKQNLFWAFAYNAIGIGIAVAGWLNPIWAAAAMVASSLFVTTNSLRLAAGNGPVGPMAAAVPLQPVGVENSCVPPPGQSPVTRPPMGQAESNPGHD